MVDFGAKVFSPEYALCVCICVCIHVYVVCSCSLVGRYMCSWHTCVWKSEKHVISSSINLHLGFWVIFFFNESWSSLSQRGWLINEFQGAWISLPSIPGVVTDTPLCPAFSHGCWRLELRPCASPDPTKWLSIHILILRKVGAKHAPHPCPATLCGTKCLNLGY